ncbi:MAG: hypothetical protein AMR96_05615 [Candidatus Adiutrix intracellularis]|nr:MAG: hypothetical protein AMR96_05615 [Candidatus Adiutrix intracellularis]MDR2827499.1 lipid-A-disaccharide synthase [Candidatus Adiutrix intracellularis]
MTKVMLSAGESSGEMHGAALVEAARRKGLDWDFFGLGGDRMAAAGVRLLGHIRDTCVMGLTEVLGALPRLLAVRSRLKRALEVERPDILVLIDAPDFNLPLARCAAALGLPVVYFICPSVWAWREGRLKTLARYTRRRLLLFPFEKKFYEERQVSADWVGHPIFDELFDLGTPAEIKITLGLDPGKKLVAILPGSRQKIFARLAPIFFKTADLLLERDLGLGLVLPLADSLQFDFVAPFLAGAPARVRERLVVKPGLSRPALAAAEAALLASGTSSVEAVFLGTPPVVAYKGSILSWFIARHLVRLPYVTIANLVAGREIVPEFLQGEVTPDNLARALWPLIEGGPVRERMAADLAEVRSGLGGGGGSNRVVDIIAEELAGRRETVR